MTTEQEGAAAGNSSREETQHQDIVLSLATSPGFARDGICYAGRSSGLYRSDDGGLTWRSTYDSLGLDALLTTTTVAISSDFESDRSVFAGVHGAVLRSADAGNSWNVAMLPSPPPVVSALEVSPDYVRDGTVLAGTLEDGVFRSADRGGSWSPWNFGLLDLCVLSMAISPDFAADETVYAGTESGIFRSTNGGRAWREVSFPDELAPVLSLAVSPRYADDGVLFAGTESRGLLRSMDRGHTWTFLGEDAVTGPVNSVVLSPELTERPNILALLDEALLVSRDGGQSWSHWTDSSLVEQGASCVAAPHGLGPDAPLLVGLVEGGVVRL